MSDTLKFICSVLDMGSVLAMIISWSIHKSILSAILHGLFSWGYVIYYAYTQ